MYMCFLKVAKNGKKARQKPHQKECKHMEKDKNNIVKFSVTNESGIKGLSEDSSLAIVMEHGALTLKACKEISDFVYNLPLERGDYDKLLELLKEQLLTAEREQYMKGFLDGVHATKAGTLEVLADRLLVSDDKNIF